MTFEAFLEMTVGAVVGAAAIFPFRKRNAEFLRAYFGATLIVAAVIYLAFAYVGTFRGSAISGSLGLEASGVLLFSVVAIAGWKLSPALLAAGWLGHIYWDAALHQPVLTAYVPEVYPGFCIGFHLVFGSFIVYYFYLRKRL
jgi:hypothetical protein